MRAAYDLPMALRMARISREAYRRSTIDIGGTQVYVIKSAVDIVVAFRGTELNCVDILTDIYAFFDKEGTHSGFHDAYMRVDNEIRKLIDDEDCDIYLTGHSLGGALATIAATKLERPNLKACYTFGSPRVGNQDLDFKAKCPVYRFVDNNDIVPRLPILAMGYRHVGDVRYLTKDARIIRCPSSLITESKFFLSLPFNIKGILKDHSINEYVRKLDEAQSG